MSTTNKLTPTTRAALRQLAKAYATLPSGEIVPPPIADATLQLFNSLPATEAYDRDVEVGLRLIQDGVRKLKGAGL